MASEWMRLKEWPELFPERFVGESVARITLNRPEKRNSWNRPQLDACFEALVLVRADRALKAVITRGAGPVYSSGLDLNYLRSIQNETRDRDRPPRNFQLTEAVRQFPRIMIAQVHGYCQGGSLGFMNAHDLVIAAEDAQLDMPEMMRGSFGQLATSTLFHAQIPIKKATLIQLTSINITGAEADRMGLVSLAMPAAELEATTTEMARDAERRNQCRLPAPRCLSLAVWRAGGRGRCRSPRRCTAFHCPAPACSTASTPRRGHRLRRELDLVQPARRPRALSYRTNAAIRSLHGPDRLPRHHRRVGEPRRAGSSGPGRRGRRRIRAAAQPAAGRDLRRHPRYLARLAQQGGFRRARAQASGIACCRSRRSSSTCSAARCRSAAASSPSRRRSRSSRCTRRTGRRARRRAGRGGRSRPAARPFSVDSDAGQAELGLHSRPSKPITSSSSIAATRPTSDWTKTCIRQADRVSNRWRMRSESPH